MRTTSLWIAVALVCGCKSNESTRAKPAAAGTIAADQLGTFTCKGTRDATGKASLSPCADSTDHFDATVPVVHVTFTTPDLPKTGDTYVIQWIATDVGSAAPANTVIGTLDEPVGEVVAGTKSYTVNSNLTKPTNGWPIGKYRVEIKMADKVVTTAPFTIQ